MEKDAVVQAIRSCLSAYSETPSVPRCLIAFSGGADSVALLSGAWKLQKAGETELCVLHVHHGIRGAEADRDAAFCRDFCEERKIACYLQYVDVPAYAQEKKIGLEEAARHLRYQALEQIALEEKVHWILTAHHQDDQAETVLLRLLRGTSPTGLSGIAPRHGKYLRPLLQLPKERLLQYCREEGLPFVEDSTNANADCPRNYLRNEILPRLYTEYPNGAKAIARVAELLREEEAYFSQQLTACGTDLDRKTLQQMPLPLLRRYVVNLYYQNGGTVPLQYCHVAGMTDLILTGTTGKQLTLPGGLCARLSYEKFTVERAVKTSCASEERVPLSMGWKDFSDGSGIFCTNSQKEWEEMQNIYKLVIPMRMNSDRIVGMLYARQRQSGDRCRCRKRNHTLKHLFQESKIDASLRSRLYLVCDETQILWIPGVAVCDAVQAKEADLFLLYRFPLP